MTPKAIKYHKDPPADGFVRGIFGGRGDCEVEIVQSRSGGRKLEMYVETNFKTFTNAYIKLCSFVFFATN
jgi:hypothetical protein